MSEQEPRTEAQLVNRICREVLRRYPSAWIFHPVGNPYQMSGVPDLLMCIEGLFIGMEVKHRKPSESEEYARSRTSPGQRHQIALINASGGIAGTVISVDEALDLIRRGFVKQESLRTQRSEEKEQ